MVDVGEGEYRDLSNFEPHEFQFRGVRCGSMEGLLQSLKFPIPDKQVRVAALWGVKAKWKGKKKKWYLDHTLYWQGKAMCCFGEEYQALVREAYYAMASQSEKFRSAIMRTGDQPLCHSIGKSDPRYTILTESEFVETLKAVREYCFSACSDK